MAWWPKIGGVLSATFRLGTGAGKGTLDASGLTAARTFTLPDATGTVLTTAAAAAQSDQETATSTTTFVPPARQHFHPSAVKGWCKFTVAAGVVTVRASYGVSSVSRTSTGLFVVNWGTSFSSTHYAFLGSAGLSGSVINCFVVANSAFATSNAQVSTFNTAGTLTDPDVVCVVALGDF